MPFWENQVDVTLIWLDARNEQRDVTSKWYIPWPNTAVRDDAAVQDSSTIKAGNLLMNTNDDVYGKLVHKNSRDIYIHTYRLIFTTLKSLVYICHIWSMTKTNGRLGKCDTHPNRLLRKSKKNIQNPAPLNSQKGWRFFSYNPAT